MAEPITPPRFIWDTPSMLQSWEIEYEIIYLPDDAAVELDHES